MVRPEDVTGQSRWPVGHSAWAFEHPGHLEGRAMSFFAEGARRGDRLMFVTDDPVLEQWPADLIASGLLQVASTREVYGERCIVVPAQQRATFAEALGDALQEGFAGIRVLADNSSLVEGSERLAAWMEWEELADQFMAENPVTGLCGFDRSRLDPGTLDRVLAVHHEAVNL